MKHLDVVRYALSSCVAVAMLAGCGGSQSPLGALGAIPQSNGASIGASRAPHGSGKFVKALFYAFGDGELAIFNVSFIARMSLRTAVNIPYTHLHGACSDPSGHVFVTQSGGSDSGKVIEFAHAGTTAIATLSDKGMATACAYDRSTGNLAVANSFDANAPGGPGPDIAVYASEKGKPTLYADPLSDSIDSCSYDQSGNLFISGMKQHGHFVLTELPQGSGTAKAMTVVGAIGGENRKEGVQWHLGSLYITSIDRRHAHSARLIVSSLNGSTATVTGTIKLHTVNYDEKPFHPWTVLFGTYLVTSDRTGASAFIVPLHCSGTCVLHRGERHLLRIAKGFVSVAVSAIRPHEGE